MAGVQAFVEFRSECDDFQPRDHKSTNLRALRRGLSPLGIPHAIPARLGSVSRRTAPSSDCLRPQSCGTACTVSARVFLLNSIKRKQETTAAPCAARSGGSVSSPLNHSQGLEEADLDVVNPELVPEPRGPTFAHRGSGVSA